MYKSDGFFFIIYLLLPMNEKKNKKSIAIHRQCRTGEVKKMTAHCHITPILLLQSRRI
jgi:hypothetical protein